MIMEPIHVGGLRDFQAALKRMDGQTQKQLRVVFNDVAEELAGDARRKVPRRSGRAAGSMKARSGQREARIVAGGRKAPYYPWLDFGGTVGRGRTGRGGVASAAGRSDAGTAGSVKRRFLTDGRYLYPTWRSQRAHIQKRLEESIVDLAQRVGLKVR